MGTEEQASIKEKQAFAEAWTKGDARMAASFRIIPPGKGATLKGHVVHVIKRTRARWLILEAHPKIFPPPTAVR